MVEFKLGDFKNIISIDNDDFFIRTEKGDSILVSTNNIKEISVGDMFVVAKKNSLRIKSDSEDIIIENSDGNFYKFRLNSRGIDFIDSDRKYKVMSFNSNIEEKEEILEADIYTPTLKYSHVFPYKLVWVLLTIIIMLIKTKDVM